MGVGQWSLVFPNLGTNVCVGIAATFAGCAGRAATTKLRTWLALLRFSPLCVFLVYLLCFFCLTAFTPLWMPVLWLAAHTDHGEMGLGSFGQDCFPKERKVKDFGRLTSRRLVPTIYK